MKLRTKRNLYTAMHSGALDVVKYHHFAACVLTDGDWELATAFQDAADRDRRQHLGREAELEPAMGQNAGNLRNARKR